MGKRQEKNKKVKENYVHAAQSVFIRHGYRGATTAEIAVEAGLSEGNLYRHFESKHDLLVKIMHRIYELYNEMLEEYVHKSDDPLEMLEEVFKFHADFIRKYPQEAQMLSRVCPFLMEDRDTPCKTLLTEQNKLIRSSLEKAVEKGVKSGRFADVDVQETARILSFLLHGYLRVQLLSKDPRAGALKSKRLIMDFCRRALEK
ncbi:MAG: TetR/AcrR family transcriptional regulator [Desulfonatronovibrionaceae bacterium]